MLPHNINNQFGGIIRTKAQAVSHYPSTKRPVYHLTIKPNLNNSNETFTKEKPVQQLFDEVLTEFPNLNLNLQERQYLRKRVRKLCLLFKKIIIQFTKYLKKTYTNIFDDLYILFGLYK